jgi:hypothetical protein
MKIKFGTAHVIFGRSSYLLQADTNGAKLYTGQHDLHESLLDQTAFDMLPTCDIVVLNSALFWKIQKRRTRQNIGKVIVHL